MKHENVKKMVALALLAALVVVLQTVASGIKVGPIPITLTLVPIVIGAVSVTFTVSPTSPLVLSTDSATFSA